jgi:hypothetical protein
MIVTIGIWGFLWTYRTNATVWGLWFLLPVIGNLIWYIKVQRVLNEFWASKGSRQV